MTQWLMQILYIILQLSQNLWMGVHIIIKLAMIVIVCLLTITMHFPTPDPSILGLNHIMASSGYILLFVLQMLLSISLHSVHFISCFLNCSLCLNLQIRKHTSASTVISTLSTPRFSGLTCKGSTWTSRVPTANRAPFWTVQAKVVPKPQDTWTTSEIGVRCLISHTGILTHVHQAGDGRSQALKQRNQRVLRLKGREMPP